MASHQLTQEQIEVLADIVGSEEKVREWHKEFLVRNRLFDAITLLLKIHPIL